MAAHSPSLDSGHSFEGLSQAARKYSDHSSEELLEKQVDVTVTESGPPNGTKGTCKKIGWKRLTVVLIVEAIALGTLSIPAAFAAVGMVGGVILTVGFGLIAVYAALKVGEVKILYPHITDYPEAVRQLGGRTGYMVKKLKTSPKQFIRLLTVLSAS